MHQCRVIPKVDSFTWNLIKASFAVVEAVKKKSQQWYLGSTIPLTNQGWLQLEFNIFELKGLTHGLCTCVVHKFYVLTLLPAMSVKPISIYPHICKSSWSVIKTLTFSDIYKILHSVVLYVLMSVLASYFMLPQHSNSKSKKLFTFNGSNLHLIINFSMLIENFPCNCIHCVVSILCFIQWAFCYTL